MVFPVYAVVLSQAFPGCRLCPARFADYQQMGVRTIIVINPEADIVSRYQDGILTPQEPSECPGSDCRMDWRHIRELLD